jgi:adenine phosphoribosyltransferase
MMRIISKLSDLSIGFALGVVATSIAIEMISYVSETYGRKPCPRPSDHDLVVKPTDDELLMVKKAIRRHDNFPLEGIVFRDFFPVFHNPEYVEIIANEMASRIISQHARENNDNTPVVDAVIGLDARGFLLGPIIARKLNTKFLPIRKPGKLPGACYTTAYVKEYGSDNFSLQSEPFADESFSFDRVAIVDDVLATGGTLSGAVDLVRQAGAKHVSAVCVLDIQELNGAAKVVEKGVSVSTIYSYTDADE